MYFLLVSLIYITAAQLSVKGVTERGFFIQFDNAKQILGDRVHWVAHLPSERLSIKEMMNGVTSLGEGCSGRVTSKQLRTNSKFEVRCALDFGKQYTLEAVITKTGEDAQILSADFDFSNQRRRLLNTPSASPVTSAPTTAPVVSTMPSRAPVTRAPTSDGAGTIHPSAFPSSIPSSLPSTVPTITDTPIQQTTESTTQIMSTSIADDDASTFAGFDLSSGGDIALFVFVIFLLLAVLALVLGGPYLYRRYYETFGNKSINAASSPKATAKLSEIWEETIGGATKKLSELSGKLGSSFLSESKIEIAPIKSEDRIRMSDPVE